MCIAKKYWVELLVTGSHITFSIAQIGHEFIVGDLDAIISLNGLLELGATTTGLVAVITLLRHIKSATNPDK